MLQMLPFILFLLFFATLAWLDILEERQRQMLLWVVMGAMVLFAGGRWLPIYMPQTDGGGIIDYISYKHAFDAKLSLTHFWRDYINSDNYIKSMDVGYVFICSLFSHIFPNVHAWFLLYNAVTVLIFFVALRRIDVTRFLFFVLFIYVARLYFQYNFVMIRQVMAMAIVWCAVPFVEDRRGWRFLLLCLLAASQHVSALVFLAVWPLCRLNLSNLLIAVSLSSLFAMGVLGITGRVIMAAVEGVLGIVGFDVRFASYFMQNEISGINMLNFVEVLPFLYLAISFKRQMLAVRYGRLFFNMLIFYTAYLMLTMDYMPLTRISAYFIICFLFIVNFAFSHYRHQINAMIVEVFMWLYFIVYALRYIIMWFNGTHYSFFLFNL